MYCQVGHTSGKSITREPFFLPDNIYKKVGEHLELLSKDNKPDYLTFVSNGEPTLDINLGKSIKLLKKFGIPVAVITNTSLITQESVRDDLNNADWVSLKFDAGDKNIWKKINHPVPELNFDNIINSINLFATDYEGILCTETMLVGGINDSADNVIKVSELIEKIKPSKSYIAIPTRPPAIKTVRPPGMEVLHKAWQIFNKKNITTEFLTGFEGTDNGYTGNIYNDILNITAVHPLREDSLFNLIKNNNADIQVIKSLISQRLIKATHFEGQKYYLREYHRNI